jgi:quercetin dioxygenase-like cupin family protein
MIMAESEKENQKPKVQALSELVSYQGGSVVSREIIRKHTGTITVFAFDKGQGLSEHIAPFDALVQLLEGDAEVTISGIPYRLKGGVFIILPAGLPHALRAMDRFKMLLVMVKS